MKKKRFAIRRKTKAIIGLILCLALLVANIALRDYTLSKNTVLEHLEDYYSTGELELVTELPALSLEGTSNYRFLLMEGEDCIAMMSIYYNLLHGWLDGPCLIVETDDTKPLDIAYNSFTCYDDENKEQMRIIGRVNDSSISYVEVEISYRTTGSAQAVETQVLSSGEFIAHGGEQYLFIDSVRILGNFEHMTYPIVAKAYNASGDLVYTQEIVSGQGTSIG